MMRTSWLGFWVSFVSLFFAFTAQASPANRDLHYTLGVKLSEQLAPYGLSEEALAEIIAGLRDAHKGALRLDPNTQEEALKLYLEGIVKERAEGEQKKGAAFMEVFKQRPGTLRSASGALYRVTFQGTGRKPLPKSLVHVRYEGRTVEGQIFDSSKIQGKDELGVAFPLNRVIPCWTEVLQLLPEGSKAQLVCPANLAYGLRGASPMIPPGATLIFEVELLKVGAL